MGTEETYPTATETDETYPTATYRVRLTDLDGNIIYDEDGNEVYYEESD